MQIGIIGTGRMGSGLGRLWLAAGHVIMFGSREPEKAAAMAANMGLNANGGAPIEAAAFGEVVVLATPWDVTEAVVRGVGSLAGKVVIDMTNALDEEGGAALPNGTSAAEQIATWATGARVVKAFNSIYFRVLDAPEFAGQAASGFYCGDDAEAKATAARLIADAGFDPVDCGPLFVARHLEWLAALWIHMAFRSDMGQDFAFKLLRR